MNDESLIYMACDQNPKAYESYWDQEWVKEIELAVHGTPLEWPFSNLVTGWRTLSEVHRLPYTVAVSLKAFYDSFRSVSPGMLEFVDIQKARLVSDLENAGCRLTRSQKRTLERILKKQAKDAAKFRYESIEVFTEEDIWRSVIQAPHLPIAIDGSQRMIFSGLYFYYEDFLKSSFAALGGLDDYKAQTGALINDFAGEFGESASKHLLTCDPIRLAREVRNAIAHNGCRVDRSRIDTFDHDFEFDLDQKIMIVAGHTRGLFSTLKSRVADFVRIVV